MKQKRWLGTFSLPIAVLFGRSQIEGTFALELPLGLHGYVRQANPLLSMGLDGGGRGGTAGELVTSRGVQVEMSADGQLSSPSWSQRIEHLGRGAVTPTQLSIFVGCVLEGRMKEVCGPRAAK